MEIDPLTSHYEALEAQWTLTDSSTDYGRLVVPTGNADDPLHRWFHLKEAFSSRLLARLIKDASWSPSGEISLLDPFAGSGTSILSALSFAEQHNIAANLIGIERNPIIRTIAAAKTVAALRGSSLVPSVEKSSGWVVDQLGKFQKSSKQLSTPSPTLNNEKYYPRSFVNQLLALRILIEEVQDEETRLLLKTCLAAAVEPAGKLRRDGRALRYVHERTPLPPEEVFKINVRRCLEDLNARAVAPKEWSAKVVTGDARHAAKHCNNAKYDWIVFSPPYPNNIDYTEVYKTEAWILGCYPDVAAMRDQRLSTIRSHPSIRFPDDYWYKTRPDFAEIDRLISPLLEAVPRDSRYKNGRVQLIKGYADDMLRVLTQTRSLVKPTGRCAFVVGNSVHGAGTDQFTIAADLVMCALASFSGWHVEEIRVARWLKRRGETNHYLRESVVCLKPAIDR